MMNLRALKKMCFAVAAALIVCVSGVTPEAYAQNWSADDNSIEARRAERYQQLVDQSPEESYAFNMLMQSVGKGAAYEKLLKTYEAKVAKKPDNYNLNMVLGHMYRYGGRLDQAMASYQKAEKIKSTAIGALSIAKVEEASKNFVEATNAYERALKLASSKDQKIEILRSMAEIAISRRDMPRAKSAFAQLIAIDDSLFVRRELAQIYEQNRMYDEARETLLNARSLRSVSADEKYRIDLDVAALWEAQNRDEEAAKIYDALESQLPASHWMRREVSSRKIDIARRAGNVNELLQTLQKLWKNPTLEQRLELAQLYDETGQASEAENQYKKAIADKPDHAEAREKYISFLRSHGRVDDANKARVDRLKVKSLSANFEYHYELYEAYVQQKRIDDAIKVLDNARNVFKGDFDKLQRIADTYMLHGRSAKALEIYSTEVKAHPNDLNAIEGLGDYYDLMGQKEQALQTWKRIENVNMDRTTRLETLARIYDEHGYAQQALEMYSRVARDNPKDCQILKSNAEILARSGKADQAVEAYEKLRDACKSDATTRIAARGAAQILASRGMASRAIQKAISQAEAQPNNATLTKYAALLALSLDMPRSVVGAVEAYVAAHPDDADIKYTLVSLYEASDDADKARHTLESLTNQSNPQAQRSALVALAEFDDAHGDFDEARANLAKALEIDSNDADMNERMGDVLTKLRLYSEASNYYQEASQIDPQNKSYAFKYATSLSMTGRDAEADDIYMRIVSTANDETLIRKAAERAIDYHAWKNDLEKLQNAWRPLLFANQRRELYVEIMLQVAELQALPHIQAIKSKEARAAVADRYALHELADQYTRAVNEALLSSDAGLVARGLNAAQWLASASVVETLGSMIDTSAVNTLDRQKQQNAVRAMAHAQYAVAVPKLITVFNDASAPRALREHALWALGLMNAKNAQAELVKALDAPVDSFRILAIFGLARQNALPDSVANMAKNDPSRTVQNVAAWAVFAAKTGAKDEAVVKALQPSYVLDSFADTLADATDDNKTSNGFHAYQLWMVSRLDNDLAAQRMLEVLWVVGGEMRSAAASLIGQNASAVDVSGLTSFEANDLIFSESASFYANEVDIEGVLDHVTRQQTSDESQVASWFQRHSAAVGKAIQKLLSTSDDARYREAKLRMFGDLTARHGLIADAMAHSPELFDVVKHTLSLFNNQLKTWMNDGLNAFGDSDAALMAEAAMFVAARFDLGFSSELVEMANQTTNKKLQFSAIEALALSSAPEAREALRELADHADWLIRASAVQHLDPNDNDDRAALEKATSDAYAIVRQTATGILNHG